MVSPLRGETELIGCLTIANRLTEGTTFSEDDLRLLETLANQAAVALENGHLEQSLAELSRLKEQLRYQAYHDPLTALANRSLFLERVDERLADGSVAGIPVVMFLDLDDFKVVNDTFGHAAGDRLLADVADRLRSVLRTGDLAARLGGDEFAVLLEDAVDLRHSLTVGTRVIDALRVPFPVAGEETTVGASIGLAAGRVGIERADDLLRNADVAMYQAKSSGKNRVAVFEPMMHEAILARSQLSAELSRSVAQGDLQVDFQPILELGSARIVWFEALVRWRHPARGLVGPEAFIALAEETGIILPLGRWVLAEACREAARWATIEGLDLAPGVTVNLSAQQLQDETFVDELRAILTATGLAPSHLVLEMTETVLFRDTSTTIARLEAIRDLGVKIAIDDFGTGYSSLGYLRRFHVDILKIAREFIGAPDSEEWAFAAAILALGRTLGLTVVAEGIEEPRQLARLRALGCEFGQGFLFARPQDAAKTAVSLTESGARAASTKHAAEALDQPTPTQRTGLVPDSVLP
jgi:diguanylate cyclase (GGDEF)-like protein